jgi:hypothetical protein
VKTRNEVNLTSDDYRDKIMFYLGLNLGSDGRGAGTPGTGGIETRAGIERTGGAGLLESTEAADWVRDEETAGI